MNLEHLAQKIVDQYPPLEIFSSLVETASGLYNSAYDTGALDELCSEEELAQVLHFLYLFYATILFIFNGFICIFDSFVFGTCRNLWRC